MNFEFNLTQIIIAVIALIFSVITGYLIPWIKSNTNEHTYKLLEMACSSAVYFAQQWYKQEDGEKKKEEAIKYAEKWLSERGIKVDMELVSDTIEAELKKIKSTTENFKE